MNADGTGVVQLTRNDVSDSTPVFPPGGRFIVRASELDGNLDVFRMAADGSDPVRVTSGDGVERTGSRTKPRFSADGKRILGTRTVGTRVDIFVIELR